MHRDTRTAAAEGRWFVHRRASCRSGGAQRSHRHDLLSYGRRTSHQRDDRVRRRARGRFDVAVVSAASATAGRGFQRRGVDIDALAGSGVTAVDSSMALSRFSPTDRTPVVCGGDGTLSSRACPRPGVRIRMSPSSADRAAARARGDLDAMRPRQIAVNTATRPVSILAATPPDASKTPGCTPGSACHSTVVSAADAINHRSPQEPRVNTGGIVLCGGLSTRIKTSALRLSAGTSAATQSSAYSTVVSYRGRRRRRTAH